MKTKQNNQINLILFTLKTEIGTFYCYFSQKGLLQMLLEEDLTISSNYKNAVKIFNLRKAPKNLGELATVNFEILKDELNGYFNKKLKKFSIPIDTSFYTDFQLKVINYLTTIPFGHVESYSVVANKIGKPKACRAVGNAVGSNRTLIVVPCHRVIKSDGSIGWFGGYGNGKELKKRILAYEGVKFKD